MSTPPVASNKRRELHREPNDAGHGGPDARKRRAFLQTMGQQLREFGPEGTSPDDSRRDTFDASPGMGPGSRVANPSVNTANQPSEAGPANTVISTEHDQIPAGAALSASKCLWASAEVSRGNPETIQCTFEDLLDFSRSYFDHWHPAFPFLHAPSLLDFFRQMSQRHFQDWNTAILPVPLALQLIILRSIMSISAMDRRQTKRISGPLHPVLVFQSYNDAISSVQLVLTEESSMLSLQTLLSVQLFLITMHRYNAASRLEGLAERMVYQLELQSCPFKMRASNGKEAELRKRLFWSIFCIDRYISIRLGHPLGIRSTDMNVCFPHSETHGEEACAKGEHDSRLDLLEFLARHAHVRGSIMEARSNNEHQYAHREPHQSIEIEAEHAKWWNIVEEHLVDDEREHTIDKAHQVTLIILRYESILALHRTTLALSNKDATYNVALQRCIGAARSIINTLHKAMKGFGAFDGSPGQNGYEPTPLLWPSFTWAIWMSAFVVITASTEGQIPRTVALKLADRSIDVLGHLALRGTSWPEACIIAIQNLTERLRTVSSRSSTVGHRENGEKRQDRSTATTSRMASSRDIASSEDYASSRLPRQQHVSRRASPHDNAYVSWGTMHPHHAQMNTQPVGDVGLRSHHSSHPLDYHGSMVTSGNLAANDEMPQLPNTYMAGSGTFLGIAQQSSDIPIPNDDIMQLFNAEDMSLWVGNEFDFGRGF